MIRIVKTGLIITVVLWGFFGALGNVLHWDETLGSVAAVMMLFGGVLLLPKAGMSCGVPKQWAVCFLQLSDMAA